MSSHAPSGVASARPAPPRGIEDVLRAVIEANPRDFLQTFCGVILRDGDVITVEPAPWAQPEEAPPGSRMNNLLQQTETGREIARKNREEGHVDSMRAALHAAYGDITDLDELARHLAERDHSANIARIIAGATLDDLRA